MFVASPPMAQHALTSGSPSEVWQSQFAATAEILTLQRDDLNKKWGQFGMNPLLDQFVDMDNVTTQASVERKADGMSVTYIVTGEQVDVASIKRMVLAHNPMLQASLGWTVIAEEMEGGATMLVRQF